MRDIHSKARDVALESGDTVKLFRAEYGLYVFCVNAGHLEEARQHSAHLLQLSAQLNDPITLVEAHEAVGITQLQIGEFSEAELHLGEAIRSYRPDKDFSHLLLYRLNPAVLSHCHLARCLWFRGYPDKAIYHVDEARGIAQHESVESLCYALLLTADIYQFRGAPADTVRFLNQAIHIASEYKLATESSWGDMMWGWAIGMQGHREQGIAKLQKSLETYKERRGSVARTKFLCLLADLLRYSNQPSEGLEVIEEAFKCMRASGERYYESELYRVQGELLALTVSSSVQPCRAPITCLEQALHISRRLQARSFELRQR